MNFIMAVNYSDRMRSASRTLLAWLAVAAMLFAATGSSFVGHAGVDRDCAPVAAGSHDHSAHRIGQEPEPEPGHCAACHLTRSVRIAAAGPVVQALVSATRVAFALPGGAPRSLPPANLAPRAPPALLS
jgi:mono/diheme cytochrome c family protein